MTTLASRRTASPDTPTFHCPRCGDDYPLVMLERYWSDVGRVCTCPPTGTISPDCDALDEVHRSSGTITVSPPSGDRILQTCLGTCSWCGSDDVHRLKRDSLLPVRPHEHGVNLPGRKGLAGDPGRPKRGAGHGCSHPEVWNELHSRSAPCYFGQPAPPDAGLRRGLGPCVRSAESMRVL
jgi:hypothetical protein